MQKIIVRVGVREDGSVFVVGSNAPDGLEIEIITVPVNALTGGRATMPASELFAAQTVVPPAPDANLPTIEQILAMPLEALLELFNCLPLEGFDRLCLAGFDPEWEFQRRGINRVVLSPDNDTIMIAETVDMLAGHAVSGPDGRGLLANQVASIWDWLNIRFYDPSRPLPPHRFDELLKTESVSGLGRAARLLRIAGCQMETIAQFNLLGQLVDRFNVRGVILGAEGAVLIEETVLVNTPNAINRVKLPAGSCAMGAEQFLQQLANRIRQP